MKVGIDTSSLLSLVRYYLPFDKNSILFDFIKRKIEQSEIIIIDKVLEQCSYISNGLVIKKLSYLNDKSFLKSAKLPLRTNDIIAPSPAKFLRQVDNQFVNTVVLKQQKINDVEYENRKNHFMNDTDMRLILFCLNLIESNEDEEVILVTEETESSNDNKLFKKIPFICKQLDITKLTLPQLLEKYEDIEFEFK